MEDCKDLHLLANGSLTAVRYREEIVRAYADAVGTGFLLVHDNARPQWLQCAVFR